MDRRHRLTIELKRGSQMRNIPEIACFLGVVACGLLAGCEGRPALMPNSDPAMNRTSTQFAADAARRFPYPQSGPRGKTAAGRAEIDLMLTRLQILNSSDEDWNEVDIWVNQSYVCHVPSIPKGKQKVETVEFTMLYNMSGHYFTTDGGKTPITLVEMRKDGKLCQIPLVLAD
jgi:hypothetical protein